MKPIGFEIGLEKSRKSFKIEIVAVNANTVDGSLCSVGVGRIAGNVEDKTFLIVNSVVARAGVNGSVEYSHAGVSEYILIGRGFGKSVCHLEESACGNNARGGVLYSLGMSVVIVPSRNKIVGKVVKHEIGNIAVNVNYVILVRVCVSDREAVNTPSMTA